MINLTKSEIIEELKFYISNEEISNLKSIKELRIKLLEIINNNKIIIKADELINYKENFIFCSSLDGWVDINDFYIKKRKCVKLFFEDNNILECSIDHLIETTSGWKYADKISKYDLILTKFGITTLKEKQYLEEQLVYDFEVNSINHRYLSNNISSHNTSKTFASCYYAINCLKTHKYEKIILTKPVQEAGENLGFLPGSIDEKIAPHYESFVTNILKFVDKKTLERNYKDGIIENKPLAYMRGANFDDCLIIGDEFQNADIRALIMFITRMGKNSKVIICGDVSQHDIGKDYVALEYLIKLIGDVQGVGVFRFSEEDIMRHPILIEITKRYEKAKREDDKLPKVKKS